MTTDSNQRDARVAEAVRDACGRAAAEAYEDAGIRGLCEEGRFECALSAIRAIDVASVIASVGSGPTSSRDEGV